MIYIDTSVVLAQLLAADRQPPPSLWEATLVSSRLLEYEVLVVVHRRGLTTTHGVEARALLEMVSWIEMIPTVLARALEPFPTALRTHDALHLASALFLKERTRDVSLATYDHTMIDAAKSLELPLVAL